MQKNLYFTTQMFLESEFKVTYYVLKISVLNSIKL